MQIRKEVNKAHFLFHNVMTMSLLIASLCYSSLGFGYRSGVRIIPKIAGFLDPKIFFCSQLKKKIKNFTNKFAPNCPQLEHFQIPLTHLPPIGK